MLIYKNTFYDEKSKVPLNLENNCRVIIYDKFGDIKSQFQISTEALKGTESIFKFIKNTKTNLSCGDIVLVYSDGFSNFLYKKSFIFQLLNFNKSNFENYICAKAQNNYLLYGKTKAITIFKI